VFPADLESILIQQNFGAHEIAGKSNGLSKWHWVIVWKSCGYILRRQSKQPYLDVTG
jgi:hypothetical protein